jgi:hypothetical protein
MKIKTKAQAELEKALANRKPPKNKVKASIPKPGKKK